MSTQEITRRFSIDMGHRLVNHEGKCKNIHGHRYEIEISCRGPVKLDAVGRVIDFGVIKQEVGAWLDEVFDHGFVAEKDDPVIPFLIETQQKHVVIDCPPSVENLVHLWFDGAAELLAGKGIVVTKVRAYETENCWSEYTLRDVAMREAAAYMETAPRVEEPTLPEVSNNE